MITYYIYWHKYMNTRSFTYSRVKITKAFENSTYEIRQQFPVPIFDGIILSGTKEEVIRQRKEVEGILKKVCSKMPILFEEEEAFKNRMAKMNETLSKLIGD